MPLPAGKLIAILAYAGLESLREDFLNEFPGMRFPGSPFDIGCACLGSAIANVVQDGLVEQFGLLSQSATRPRSSSRLRSRRLIPSIMIEPPTGS